MNSPRWRNEMLELLRLYAKTESGSWLNSFNPETINVQFISGTEGKRQAEYRPLENSVLLAEDSDGGGFRYCGSVRVVCS